MKIRITLTVDVDAAAWKQDYDVTSHQLRDDVRDWVIEAVDQQLIAVGYGEVVRFAPAGRAR